MLDIFATAFTYAEWGVLLLLAVFGLLGVAAFLGPKRYDPENGGWSDEKTDLGTEPDASAEDEREENGEDEHRRNIGNRR